MIQLCCIGDDSVDKKSCADHGVMVCNDPVSNGRSVVELVILNMIDKIGLIISWLILSRLQDY